MIFPSAAFLDSSSWNTTSLQVLPTRSNIIISPSAVVSGEANLHNHGSAMPAGALSQGGDGGDGIDDGSAAAAGPAKPMSMSERARLARIPQPEPGLKCPRCDSTNTKFCYFNNYSLTQPRHFCRACRRYWTRGGSLRNIHVGGGYRRHAKRAKPKAAATLSATSSTTSSATSACTSTVAVQPTNLQATLNSSGSSPVLPPLQQYRSFTDFEMANLGFNFPGGGGISMPRMEQQWRAQSQMHSFPFLHAMDHQMAMPSTFHHLGLETGGAEVSTGKMMERDQEYPIRAMYGDVTAQQASYYSSSTTAGNL